MQLTIQEKKNKSILQNILEGNILKLKLSFFNTYVSQFTLFAPLCGGSASLSNLLSVGCGNVSAARLPSEWNKDSLELDTSRNCPKGRICSVQLIVKGKEGFERDCAKVHPHLR